jgi:hypothetical protein
LLNKKEKFLSESVDALLRHSKYMDYILPFPVLIITVNVSHLSQCYELEHAELFLRASQTANSNLAGWVQK